MGREELGDSEISPEDKADQLSIVPIQTARKSQDGIERWKIREGEMTRAMLAHCVGLGFAGLLLAIFLLELLGFVLELLDAREKTQQGSYLVGFANRCCCIVLYVVMSLFGIESEIEKMG
ncbi:hypothetical protein AABB24_014450 [Solanum stoloniferum]|uniref:Uncharacterized protein n=1 Tax=Solanum stoloniferum TaxID=62892 RepID=A0ABD2TZ69_9SOLN